MDKIQVVDLMTQNCDLKKETRRWRRAKPMARVYIMERRVYLNGRLVTHTEVAVPVGKTYELKVWDTHHEGFDVLQVTA